MMRMMKQPQETMMTGRYLIAALAAAFPIHAAGAQDAPAESANHPNVAGPGGFRVEALLGYDHDGYEHGLVYGGRVGYDIHVGGNFLLGVDGELNDVSTNQNIHLTPAPGTLVAGDGPDLYVGGRATLVLSRRFSLYGGAGYTRARHGYFFLIDPAAGPFGPIGVGHFTDDGYRLTAGTTFNLGRRAFVGAEYRYSAYERYFQREQVVGTIGFRF
jgi:outer membrane immunogenic protein